MNMFASLNENPAMTFRGFRETERNVWKHGRTGGRTDTVKTVLPSQTKFAGCMINSLAQSQLEA